MIMSRIISKHNIETIAKFNDLLANSECKSRIKVEEVDTVDKCGIVIYVPSIFNEDLNPFKVKIIEDIKASKLSLTQIIDSINYDLAEVLNEIKPYFIKLTRIKKSFKYFPDEESVKDNTITFKITLNENYYRHDK